MPTPILEEQEADVLDDLEKRLAETAPKTPEPVREEGDAGQTIGQSDTSSDAEKTEL